MSDNTMTGLSMHIFKNEFYSMCDYLKTQCYEYLRQL